MGKRKVGRPRKYATAKALSEAVDAYFDSITRNDEFIRAPSVAGLCLALGISRSTWCSYGGDEKLGHVVEWARLVVEDYWNNQLAGKFANGAKFALGSGFGWNERGRWSDRDREEPEDEENGTGVVEIAPVAEEPEGAADA